MKLKQIVIRMRGRRGRVKNYSMVTDEAENLLALTWKSGLLEETTRHSVDWAGWAGFGEEFRPENTKTMDADWDFIKAECRKPPYEHAVKTCAYVKVAPAAAPVKKKRGRKKKEDT